MVAESEGCGLEETQDRAYDCGTSAVSPVRWKQPWRLAGVLGGCVGVPGGCTWRLRAPLRACRAIFPGKDSCCGVLSMLFFF